MEKAKSFVINLVTTSIIVYLLLLIVGPPVCIASGGDTPTLQQIKSIYDVPEATHPIKNKINLIETDGKLVDTTKHPSLLNNTIIPFIWTIIGGFVGAVIALFFEKLKNPKLEIIANEEANQDHVYQNVTPSGRYKFFRVMVVNKQLPKYISWLISRSTAQQLNATIRFVEIDQTMKGRWASTLELAQANPLDYLKLANFPDPITIFPGESTFLDIFVKYENDIEAYGWNNESYLHNWRTPYHKLTIGSHQIEITLSGVNAQCKRTFTAQIQPTIDDTRIN